MFTSTYVGESPDLPRFADRLRPLIQRVATIRASVHTKLLAGFLTGALLLLAMGGLSVAVLGHMAERVDELNLVQARVDHLRQMQYLTTAQSHYRAMALLTHDPANLASIVTAKAQFQDHLAAVERDAPASERGLLSRVRTANERFNASSDRVLALEKNGDDPAAMQLHLNEEHPITHEVEGSVGALLDAAEQDASTARAVFYSDQQLMLWLVAAFSIVSLATALLLGLVLSWSFLLPLRRIHSGLVRLAAGRFDQQFAVANRDEFGDLGRNLDATRQELAQLYGKLESLNEQLRGTNTELLAKLQVQVVELARSRGLITEAEERLRREISEVLHSRVQNRLLMVWYRLEDCQALIESDPAEAARVLAEVRNQVDEIREHDVRELSHRLHPSIIRAGLLPALETLVDEMPRPPVTLQVAPAVETLDGSVEGGVPDTVRLTAYRAVEEALGNVAKHAAASKAEVDVRIDGDDLVIEVRDDGRGFEPRELHQGLGIGSLAARVERIGGTWGVESAPGRGTCVNVRLPLAVPGSIDEPQNGFDAQIALRQEAGAQT